MAHMIFLSSAWPVNNFWASIIRLFDTGNYAWTIILFTIILKLVLSPLDFVQRFYINKTNRAQAKLKPKLDKLKRLYGQNQNLLTQKQNELYQKSGVSVKSSCVIMLVYMIVTLVIFFTLFDSLGVISAFKIKKQFEDLQTTFDQSFDEEYYKNYLASKNRSEFEESGEEGTFEDYILSKEQEKVELLVSQGKSKDEAKEEVKGKKEECIGMAQDLVADRYDEIKDSWFWIRNIWLSDIPTVHEILTFDSYKNMTKDTIEKETYSEVMGGLLKDSKVNKVNGYYILSIFVVILTFFSQWISARILQAKDKYGKRVKQPTSSKVMTFIIPLMMLIFTLSSSAVFSLYLIANSLVSTVLNLIITYICNKIEDKRELKRDELTKVSYSR